METTGPALTEDDESARLLGERVQITHARTFALEDLRLEIIVILDPGKSKVQAYIPYERVPDFVEGEVARDSYYYRPKTRQGSKSNHCSFLERRHSRLDGPTT